MHPVFDFDQLNALLWDFYALTKIRITVFDANFRERASVPGDHTPICGLIRSDARGETACCACDRSACDRAAGRSDAHIYLCHAGLTEVIMPFYVQQTLAGYLLFGQVLAYPSHQEAWDAIRLRCAHLEVDPSLLKAACAQSELVSESYIHAASHILHAVASYLTLKKMATLKEERPAERLDRYISEHFTEPITVQMLCQQLQIGKTQLYSLSKQLYGSGIAQHIRHLRIEKARRLLAERPNMSVGAVADACGFSDYNYFICVFSRLTGEPPSRYRKRISGTGFRA